MIERLKLPVAESDLHALAELLVDAVDSGAAVSFLSVTPEQALDHAPLHGRMRGIQRGTLLQ